MARQSRVTTLGTALILVLVVHNAHTEETCRSGCTGAGAPKTFKYQEGTTYKYNFDSKIELTLSSAEGQKITTEVKAQVLLTQQPQCAQILRLQNLQITSNDGKKHIQIPEVAKPVRLTFHDGHLEDSLCTVPGDSQTSLNIKRAIASLFQANLQSGHETDVFGLCPTEIHHSQEGNILIINKARSLNRCAFRENVKQDFLTTAFNLHSEVKSSPLLNADYSAKLRIKNGILEEANTQEDYLYVPFSVGTSGASAKIHTILKFTGTSKDNTQVKVSQPRSIIFEDPHPVNAPTANVNTILAAVKDTTKTIGVTVNEQTAQEFVNLIRILRVSNKDDLLAVYNQVRAGVGFPDAAAAKKIFLDALLRAGNGDNIEVAIELLKNKALTPLEQKLVYLGLSTVRHTTEASITAALTLLNQPELPREAYLGIGNLAGRHCRLHNCKQNDAVAKVTQALIQKLGDGKATNRKTENDLIYILKSLGNIRHLTDAVIPKLTAIAQNKQAATRLRVTALETYISDPCKDKLRDSALAILKDIQQDSEVRIRAYLAAVQCPTPKIASAIKALLSTEPSYQVGGFIVSHIRNVRASANPDKELQKQQLGGLVLPNHFPVDPRKWSLNGEFSYAINTLGVASSVETNLIYSQNSFLPRATSLNITAEVFGHSVNFLEVETRQENLEKLLEHYLGPKGLLRRGSFQELWENKGEHVKTLIKKLREGVENSLRTRRDLTKADLESISKQVQIKTNDLNKDLDLDLSIKAFGSEIFFGNVNEDITRWTPEALIDQIVKGLSKGLDEIKDFEHTLRSNLLFLDAEFAYPTSSGFPLRLGLEGTANIQVKASGKIDVRALLKKETQIKVVLIPSANIQVAGRFTLDAWLVENGLKVVSTLHTATGGDLLVDVLKNGVDVKFGIPVEKQQVISVTHDIVSHVRELAKKEVNTPLKFAQNKEFAVCWDQFESSIGLTFCADVNGPNLSGKDVPVLPFPLSGDLKLSVEVEKKDVSLYHYRHLVHATSSDRLGAEATFEILNLQNQRKLSLQLEAFAAPERYLKANLISPIITSSAEARITTTNTEKSAFIRLLHANEEYFGKIGVSISGSPNRAVYKPILEYKTPGKDATRPHHLEGQLIVEQNGPQTKYVFDNVKLILPDRKPITLNGNLGHEPEVVFADIKASDGTNSGTLRGRLQANPNLLKYNIEVQNTLNPHANVHVKGELVKNQEEVKNLLQVIHGQDLSSKVNILTLENQLKIHNKNPQDFVFATKNKILYPLVNLQGVVDVEVKPKEVEYKIDVQYSDVKFGSELEYEYNPKPDGLDYKLELLLWALNNRAELKAKRSVSGEVSTLEHSLEINGKKAEITGKVKHHIKPHEIDVNADLTVKVPTSNHPIRVEHTLKANSNDLDLQLKVTSAGNALTDLFLKANRLGNINGNIKVNLKEKLTVHGQIKANKGAGNGDLTVELPALKKSSKFETTFTVQEPTYNILINIYPVFNTDKSKKLVISTQNKVTGESVTSRNFIDILGNKIEGNLNANYDGTFTNGKIVGEAELLLPNQHYLSGKINREITDNNHNLNGKILMSLEHRSNKNAPGAKIALTGLLKNTKFSENIIDSSHTLSIDLGNGKDVVIDLGVKRVPSGDVINIELTNKVSGSLLPGPFEASLRGNHIHKNHQGTYTITSNYLKEKLQLNGNYKLEGPLSSGELNVIVESASKVLKNIKLTSSGSLVRGESLELKGETKIVAEAPESTLVDVDANGDLIIAEKEGRLKAYLKTGKIDPISLNSGVKLAGQEASGDFGLIYGKNQKVQGSLTYQRLPQFEYKINVNLETPLENFHSNQLQIHNKRSEDNVNHHNEIILTSDSKTWNVISNLVLSQLSPSVEITVQCPNGEKSEIVAKFTKSSQDINALIRVVFPQTKFLFEGALQGAITSVDDFHIKLEANSPSLKLEKITIIAENSPQKTKSGRRIQITVKSAEKNLVTGSTSYTSREDHGKLIIEGSGSFKVKEQSQSANFKYIRQNLIQEVNGESGIEISFDGGLGQKAIDAEFKITNKQFRISNSYCEEKKQCAHIEIDAKTNTNELNHFNQVLEIAVDLRKLGLSHEFGLKAVTIRKEFLLDHTVDVHFQSQENSKYQYSLYVHPKEAAISVSTPKRTISLEAKTELPRNFLNDGGKLQAEIFFFVDKKNQPQQKSGVNTYLSVVENSVDGEIKFTNPALQRPLLVHLQVRKETQGKLQFNSVLTIDTFAQANQKLIVSVEQKLPTEANKYSEFSESIQIKSTGLNIDIKSERGLVLSSDTIKAQYNLRYHVGASRLDSVLNLQGLNKPEGQSLSLLVRLLNIDLLKSESTLKIGSDQVLLRGEFGSYGVKTAISELEVRNWNTLKYSLARKDAPKDQLLVTAALIPGQVADFRADVTKNGVKHDLIHGTIKLDEANFLKSDYGVESKNIEELLLKPARRDVEGHVDELKKVAEEWTKSGRNEVKQIGELVKKASPNLVPLRDYYLNELKKIKEEVLEDKTIKELSEFLRNIIAAVSQALGESFRHASDLVENIAVTFQDAFGKVLETIEKQLLPKLKTLIDNILSATASIISRFTDLVLTLLAKAAEIAERYQPELKQLAAVLGEFSHDAFRVALKAYENIKILVKEQWDLIYNQLKSIPAFENLKREYERYVAEGLPSTEIIKSTITDFLNTAKELTPIPEVKDLIESISQYLNQKLSHQKVDDGAALSLIFKNALRVVKALTSSLAVTGGELDLHSWKLPLPINILSKLPKLVAAKFSPLAFLVKEGVPGTVPFLNSLVNKPRNLIAPFPLYGLIAQGQHIFTFDGKHLTFPGKCNYLLARDALDGNFTIVGTYMNGLLTAISLTEGSDTITLKKNRVVTLNGVAADLPIRVPSSKPHISAYTNYEMITLRSLSGVKILCGLELTVCSVTISGFYHGRLRGLLGNGNHEPYDDFTLANGKIVSSESEFGNSYKTNGGCPAVQTVPHHGHHPAPSCDKLFGWESPLKVCQPFVNSENYKMACEHGVAAGVKGTEEAIAVAYVAACNQHQIPVGLPKEFVRCSNGEKPSEVGDKFSVKTPGKSADIVLLVDTNKKNEVIYKEYVQPLVQQITSELHTKGINDVEFHLIAYGGDNQWPSHVTSAGKFTFKGKAPVLKFAEAPRKEHIVSGCKGLDGFLELLHSIGHDVQLALGQNLQAKAYNEGFEYPFRANSIKSIIAVTGNTCEVGRFYPLQVLRTLLYRSKTIHLSLLTPFEKLVVKDAKHTKDVVGFNSESVFTLTKGKAKGGAELHKDLEYKDFCVDFVIQNKGNVFVIDNFQNAKGPSRKQFVQITSHNIVDQFLSTEEGLDCECRMVSAFKASNVCTVVQSKEKVKKAGTKS